MMDKKDAIRVLRVIQTTYRGEEQGMNELSVLSGIWSALFPESVTEVTNAFMEYAKHNKYRPTPSDLREILDGGSVSTAEESWETVRKAIRNSGWDMQDCKERWEKLPAEVKTIYQASDLWEMGRHSTAEDLEKFEKPRYIKNYQHALQTGKIKPLSIEQKEAEKLRLQMSEEEHDN